MVLFKEFNNSIILQWYYISSKGTKTITLPISYTGFFNVVRNANLNTSDTSTPVSAGNYAMYKVNLSQIKLTVASTAMIITIGY